MKRNLLATVLLLLCAGYLLALTGFGVSAPFEISTDTLPVELSSFTAAVTGQNTVRISWVTQSESNLYGYYIYRGSSSELSVSSLISDLIAPANTPSQNYYVYMDNEISESGEYYYWLYSQEIDGSGTYHGPIFVQVEMDAGQGLPAIPLHTGLRNIYPNPFNPSTTISYQLEDSGQADISIYNARGQKVQSYSRHHATPGYFNLLFDGKDTSGSSLSSGVYHVVMISGKQVSNQKIVLLK
ncbi:MAG: T9SS type A sorting domain-containing protein [Candidatus Cloacimonadaceae bacterium]|jgi:hypothetical protein|nr:T9SS type A sorting domain-containing protein [Candidatus Cloacimonadota bacterium]MCK9243615.1 T9SS type A sorting domain-containing protein [Candidatus Cloacimonadota bacterium]MDY0126910.1 T9SS type A sorting domain-containing protein [Candidatus Cloacimonadaceae bacterium]